MPQDSKRRLTHAIVRLRKQAPNHPSECRDEAAPPGIALRQVAIESKAAIQTNPSPQALASKRQWRPDAAMPAGRPMVAPPGRSVRKTDKPPGKGPFLHLAEGRLFTVRDIEVARRFYGGIPGLEEIAPPAS